MFFVYAVLLLSLVIFVLVYPIWSYKRAHLMTGQEASIDEELTNLRIEKQSLLASLSDLEMDNVQGRFLSDDYNRLKLGYERRLVKVLDQLENLKKGKTPDHNPETFFSSRFSGWNWALSVFLGVFVVSATAGIHTLVYGKIERSQRMSNDGRGAPGMPPVNPAEMVARLEKRLKENPNDLEGQMMAGRSYMALQRWKDAKKAWQKVIELDERNEVAQFNLADVLLRTATPGDKGIYEEALNHLDKALINVPREPVVLWEKGVALVHLGRTQEADQAWTTAFQNLPPNSKDAEFVKQALEELRAGKAPSN